MLLKRVTEQADQERLDCWLQSSPAAQALYHSWGFRDISYFDINLDAFGGTNEKQTSGIYRTVLMKRDAIQFSPK